MFLWVLPKPATVQESDIKGKMSAFDRHIYLPNLSSIRTGVRPQREPRFFRDPSYGGDTDARNPQNPVRTRPGETGHLTRVNHKRKIMRLQQMHMLAELQLIPSRGSARRRTDIIP